MKLMDPILKRHLREDLREEKFKRGFFLFTLNNETLRL